MPATLSGPTLDVDDDIEAFFELSLAQRWGDGAPLIPPTDERVRARLDATPHAPSHVLGELPPNFGRLTVELAAVNATMAGVAPAAFPVVLAALEAILEPDWNAFGVTATTSPAFPMLIVNGPRRDDLGIDSGAGCLGGAGGRGSMTIGRAVSLCLRNVGGQRAGDTSRTVFGQPARFGLCFGEWEERSPWPPLAVRRGVAPGAEAVTVHGGTGTHTMADVHHDDPRDLTYLIGRTMAHPMTNNFMEIEETWTAGEVVLLVNPIWAERLATVHPAIEDLQEALWESAWQPIDMFRPQYRAFLERNHRADAHGRVHLVGTPAQIVPVVCGGLGGHHVVALHSFVQSFMQTRPVLRT